MRVPTILAAACLMLVGCQPEEGCTDPEAENYNSDAVEDNGSCDYVEGCTNPASTNYNPDAVLDDGSCTVLEGCSSSDFVLMDGYNYDLVSIGGQCWFSENLRTTVYANGDVIPAGLTDEEWASTTAGATTVYGEGNSSCEEFSPDFDACDEVQSLAEYGRLYNSHAVVDVRGLCPNGWHAPNNYEWIVLMEYIDAQGFSEERGTALRSTTGWADSGNGTDDFGFSALPSGVRVPPPSARFDGAGNGGYWWGVSSPHAWGTSSAPNIITYPDSSPIGYSVRCLRD